MSALERGHETRRLGQDGWSGFLDRRGDRGTRRAGVSPTPEPPGQHGRIDATGLGPDADPRRLALLGLLEQDGDLGGLLPATAGR